MYVLNKALNLVMIIRSYATTYLSRLTSVYVKERSIIAGRAARYGNDSDFLWHVQQTTIIPGKDFRSSEGMFSLFEGAAGSGNIDRLRLVIEYGQKNQFVFTYYEFVEALTTATCSGDVPMMIFLFDQIGPVANAKYIQQNLDRGLYFATSSHNIRAVEFMIAQGGRGFLSALCSAVDRGYGEPDPDPEIVELLIRFGGDRLRYNHFEPSLSNPTTRDELKRVKFMWYEPSMRSRNNY